jgi:hypothetical protein
MKCPLIYFWQRDRELKLTIARTAVGFGWIVENWIRSLNGNRQGQQPIKLIQEMSPDKSALNEMKIMTGKNTTTNMVGNTARMITTMKESTVKENGRRDPFLGIYLILGIEYLGT